MREKTVWHGEKRGIRFEINRFKSYDPSAYKFGWSFYLWLSPNQFPADVRDQIKTDVYFTAFGTALEIHTGPIADLDWHGGMTWSSDESSPKHPFRQYKFGCDFQHLWDMHKDHELDDVEREVDKCIESLYQRWPDVKPVSAIWDGFRSKFPGAAAGDDRCFDINAKPIPYPWGQK